MAHEMNLLELPDRVDYLKKPDAITESKFATSSVRAAANIVLTVFTI
jgi:hypothetical protein